MSKRPKLSHQSTCQVEGCNLDLTSAKDYHRRHRICESHSKSPKVIVAGLERRFCQQCSRFHNLCEFDDKKRSCRRRLSDHNARRRRPQIPEAIPFSSTEFLSSIYDGRPQNFHSNRIPTTASNGTWESFCSLKMADSGNSGISPPAYTKQHLPLQHLNLGKDASVSSSGGNEAPVFPCALSLLSTSWGLNEPESPSLELIMQGNISMAQPVMQLEPQNWPIISAEHVSKEQAASTSPVNSMDFQSTTELSVPRFSVIQDAL